MKHRQKYLSVRLLAMAGLLTMAPIQGAWALTEPGLGKASNFAVLGSSAVTCDSIGAVPPDVSSVAGDVGSLTAVTGFPPTYHLCTIAGHVHVNDGAANDAIRDFHLAYNELRDRSDLACPRSDATHNIDVDLAGKTLSPGVYCLGSASPALLSGHLILDGNGDKNAVWIFKAGSSITPIGGLVTMAGGGQACNVYWQAPKEVSLDNTDFLGNILSATAVTFTGVGSSLVGRAFGDTGVTMTGGADIAISDSGNGRTQPKSCNPHK